MLSTEGTQYQGRTANDAKVLLDDGEIESRDCFPGAVDQRIIFGRMLEEGGCPDADCADDNSAATDEEDGGKDKFGPRINVQADEHWDRNHHDNEVEDWIANGAAHEVWVQVDAFSRDEEIVSLDYWLA